jgi:hypothetical protein
LEHTAIDTALTAAVRDAEVPILPMVVDRLLTHPPTRMGGWPKTAGSSRTRCAVSSVATSPACSMALDGEV